MSNIKSKPPAFDTLHTQPLTDAYILSTEPIRVAAVGDWFAGPVFRVEIFGHPADVQETCEILRDNGNLENMKFHKIDDEKEA